MSLLRDGRQQTTHAPAIEEGVSKLDSPLVWVVCGTDGLRRLSRLGNPVEQEVWHSTGTLD
jgi:hypothetical protein